MNKKEIVEVGAIVAFSTAAVGGPFLVMAKIADDNRIERDRQVEAIQNQFSGDFKVLDLRSIPGFQFNGNMSGGFLIFSGQINGETKSMLQFAWETKGEEKETIISEVPLDRVIFMITEDPTADEYKGPSARFTLDPNMGNSSDFGSINLANPNSALEVLQTVRIDMSRADYNAFRGATSTR